MGSGPSSAIPAEEFRGDADMQGDEFLEDLSDDVRMRSEELTAPLFGRQAQVVHQSLAGTHEVVLR
jgi:hypothetical protein